MKQFVKNEAKNAFLQTRAQVSKATCGTRADRASQRGTSLAQKPEAWEVVPGWTNGPGESLGRILFLFCPGKGQHALL